MTDPELQKGNMGGEINLNDTYIKSNFAEPTDLDEHINTTEMLEQENARMSNNQRPHIHNEKDVRSSESQVLERWPTLFEILNKKTQSPVDLWSFYVYMRDTQKSIDYLDFWIDTVQHMNLCKAYIKGLKQSLLVNERIRNAEKINELISVKQGTSADLLDHTPPLANFTNSDSSHNTSNRHSGGTNNSSRDSRSSSVLLELLMKNNLLEENDSHRMSSFLRGETSVRSSDPLVNAKIDDLKRKSQILDDSFLNTTAPNVSLSSSSANSTTQLLPSTAAYGSVATDQNKRESKINPEMVENLIVHEFSDSKKPFRQNHFVTREKLRETTRAILNTYFKDNAEKKIVVPKEMTDRVIKALEVNGRDDPEVFDETREFVFKAMEHEAYPNFLRYNAICNVSARSAIYRMLAAFMCAFLAFWTAYSLIFLDYSPGKTRAVVTLPFFLASYSLFSSFYRIDPILCFFGFSESRASSNGITPIREPFVKKLLLKRSLFVFAIICVVAAAFSCLFALVPGTRLHHS